MKRRISIALIAGALLAVEPAIWYVPGLSTVLAAPGGLLLHLIGTTDDIRLVDYAAYFVSGTTSWALVIFAGIGLVHLLTKKSVAA
jgi:hypothetical protein